MRWGFRRRREAELRSKRIGLVLGGGGVIGNAYLTGVLEGIRRATGWDPGTAEITVGTSAGSVNGALVALGVPTSFSYEQTTGERSAESDGSVEVPAEAGELASRSDREWTDRLYPVTGVVPRLLLSSPSAVLRGLLRPWKTPIELFVTGLLGEGFVSTRTIGQIIESVGHEGWTRRSFWPVAVCLDSGRRVVFGTPGAPRTDLARAVRASCAIPGFFAPVRVDGQRYVDGGIWSVSNLDLVAAKGLDLVVCVNPMSSLEGRSFEGPVDRITGFIHSLEKRAHLRFGRRLEMEQRRVEDSGTPVLLMQPTSADLEVIPVNLMDPGPRADVARRAFDTATAQLEEADSREAVAVLRTAAEEAAKTLEATS